MRANNGNHRIRKFNALQNFGADNRMNLHLLELGARQLSWFGDDRFRHRQLSDVMEHGRRRERLHFLFGEPQILADLGGIEANALQMIVRRMFLGADGGPTGSVWATARLSE